jgi:hypothetical protein
MKLAVGAALALALAAAGCGGGGSKTLSKEEYGSQLNQICKDYNARVTEIGQPANVAELGTKGPQLLDEFSGAISKGEKLKAPDELKATSDEFISKSKELESTLGQLVDAAKANDAAKIQEIGQKADALGKETDDLGTKLGAPACAQG